MARVLIQNVTKNFDDVTAVKNVNLEIKDKEFLVLVGPSGCGKTTLLRTIAGLEEITEGNIYIGDRLINDIPPKDRDIAMVFQNYALYPHMNVYDNMAFGLKFRGMRKKEIDERVADAADKLGLKDLLKRLPKQLSGGQRQRVAVGRAIVRQPAVFLMDEPLSNLDAKLRVQMRAELKKIHNSLQTTVVYVTHDQVEAMTLGERIAVVLNGEVQQVDKPLVVYEKPVNRFVAGFIGSPPMNFIKGSVIKKDNILKFASESFEIKIYPLVKELMDRYVGKEVIMGIRPSDVYDEAQAKWLQENEKDIITAKVDFRELMGDEIYLYLKAGKVPIIAKVGSYIPSVSGENIKVVIDLRKIHFFDSTTQKAIV
ncbi:MAG: sn-glycerol-3-phosphate ABC transporter ATP-binding protein UgpC [bacterium]